MAIPTNIVQRIRDGKFDALEDDWLSHMDESPDDIDFFAGVARALAGSGEETRAATLLDVLDEELKETERWETRLALLRSAGPLWLHESEALNREILSTLAKLHANSESLETFIELVGLRRAIDDVDKSWKKVDRLRGLLPYDVGAVVEMPGKGAGRVTELNLELDSLKIEFDDRSPIRVGLSAAAKMLVPLPSNHLLRRKLEGVEVLQRLAEDDPPGLLSQVLLSYEQALTAGEIRKALSGVVGDDTWTTWWNAARRHPQVLTSGGSSRQKYAWAESDQHAEEAVLEEFRNAEIEHQLRLYRKYAERPIGERMADELVREAAAEANHHPGRAASIWIALDNQGQAPTDADWSPTALAESLDRPLALVDDVTDRAVRQKLYRALLDHRDDVADLALAALKQEADPKLLDELAEVVCETDATRFHAVCRDFLRQPRKNPAGFLWLAERAGEDEALASESPLRFAQQILAALAYPETAAYRSRLRRLCESGGTLVRLLGQLDEKGAVKVRDAIQRSHLEAYDREQLTAALEVRFPVLRTAEESPLHATRDSIGARQAELKNLVETEIPQNRRAIQEARELGDLRENFEYKSARQRHEYLNARVAALHRDLGRARPIDASAGTSETVVIGSQVSLMSESAGQRRVTILGPWESSPENGIISYESDLGKALLAKRLGDEVEFDGSTFRIDAIAPRSN